MRIGIIGGGAAGLFTACQIKRMGIDKDTVVTIIERNSAPGKKLLLTGHGRCNITNLKDVSELKKGYHEADNFLYPALKEFGPSDTVSFFEKEIGLKLKQEDNNRMFPVTDSAASVRDALVSYISDSVNITCDTKVLDIRKDSAFEVETSKGKFSFDVIVLSCGGSSFKKTGSEGDSYKFAERLGHTIVPVSAALVAVKADGESSKFTAALSGVSVCAKASVFSGGRSAGSFKGEVLFADFGLTGPAVMEISREIPSDGNAYIELDLIPDTTLRPGSGTAGSTTGDSCDGHSTTGTGGKVAVIFGNERTGLTDEQLDQELQNLIRDHADTKITTLVSRFVPASVAGAIADRVGVAGLYAQGFTKDNRRKLCRELKHLAINLSGAPDIDKAYVTRGGVSLKEIDRKTMQSKKVSGLYVIGEAIDVDGISGGYNLQACMSEAYLVSKSILGIQ